MLRERYHISLIRSHPRHSHPRSGFPSPQSSVLILIVVALCVPLLPIPGAGRAVAQGKFRTINGHVVADRFLEVWSAQGSERDSVYVNGLPITDRHAEISLTDGKTYDTQWFERARY